MRPSVEAMGQVRIYLSFSQWEYILASRPASHFTRPSWCDRPLSSIQKPCLTNLTCWFCTNASHGSGEGRHTATERVSPIVGIPKVTKFNWKQKPWETVRKHTPIILWMQAGTRWIVLDHFFKSFSSQFSSFESWIRSFGWDLSQPNNPVKSIFAYP